MSFQAVIASREHQMLWTKVVISLATISESVRLNFSNSRVNISAINATKTSLFNVTFNSVQFFKAYTLSPQEDFSILVNAKALALIFRNYRLGNENVESFRFTINESAQNTRLDRSRNRLFIEIVTDDHLKKTYSLNFARSKDSFDLNIDRNYKDALRTQNDGTPDDERIHYLMVEIAILKNFLDMFPPSIEDFKIEILRSAEKMNLVGFNRQQVATGSKGSKESQALRQPMSLSIGLSLNDLLNNNFLDPDSDAGRDKPDLNIVYRLRDFKTYVNLVNSFNYSELVGKNLPKDVNDFHHQNQKTENFVEILFNKAGFPVLLTKKCELPNIYSGDDDRNTVMSTNEELELFRIEAILISDYEGDNIQIRDRDLIIPKFEVLKPDPRDRMAEERPAVEAEPLFVPNDDDTVAPHRNEATPNRRRFNLKTTWNAYDAAQNAADSGLEVDVPSEELAAPQSVRWAERSLAIGILDQSGSQGQALDDISSTRKRRAPDDDTDDPEEALGPTQNVYKIRGLFD